MFMLSDETDNRDSGWPALFDVKNTRYAQLCQPFPKICGLLLFLLVSRAVFNAFFIVSAVLCICIV